MDQFGFVLVYPPATAVPQLLGEERHDRREHASAGRAHPERGGAPLSSPLPEAAAASGGRTSWRVVDEALDGRVTAGVSQRSNASVDSVTSCACGRASQRSSGWSSRRPAVQIGDAG